MAVWAIADLHLSFATPNKEMDVFGEQWRDHASKIATNWRQSIQEDDLVLLPGDISWAMNLEQALPDLEWIHRLPGTKVMIRGNHDYWWSSVKKVSHKLPPSLHIVQNDSFSWGRYSIAGSRLWDSLEYRFDKYIARLPTDKIKNVPFLFAKEVDREQEIKIFQRELLRLEMSLKTLSPSTVTRIAMTHYPPIGISLNDSSASALLEKYNVDICAFGHLHNVVHDFDPLFGTKNGVRYYLVAADYCNFTPLLLCE